MYLKVLNFLDEFNVLLRQALLVRRDVDDSAVQLFDFDMKFTDSYFEFLASLGNCNFFLGHVLHLGQQLVHFSLEFGFLLLNSEDKENVCAFKNIAYIMIILVQKQKINVKWWTFLTHSIFRKLRAALITKYLESNCS